MSEKPTVEEVMDRTGGLLFANKLLETKIKQQQETIREISAENRDLERRINKMTHPERLRTFHSLEVRSHLGDKYMDIWLDDRELDGVSALHLSLDAESIPEVTLTLKLDEVNIDKIYGDIKAVYAPKLPNTARRRRGSHDNIR